MAEPAFLNPKKYCAEAHYRLYLFIFIHMSKKKETRRNR